MSQLYFGIAARPYAALAAAVGLDALLKLRGPDNRGRIVLWVIGAALGIAAIYAVRATVGHQPPAGALPGLAAANAPFLVLVAVLAILAAGIWLIARRRGFDRRTAAGAIALMAIFTVTPGVVNRFRDYQAEAASGPLKGVQVGRAAIPAGGIEAMSWLRSHSGPGRHPGDERALPLQRTGDRPPL